MRASESVSVEEETTTKKIKKTEYFTNLGSFTDLYDAIIKAEERIGSTNQEVIRANFLFGKKLEEKLTEYKKTNKERRA
ncbi:hypothetical protein Glove_227g132 [Diversispora epigaea]|uniref:Uncharacterized protein n=1 Tax=Diversispora epigaea TaxID=1348612 RepID=A0A397IMY7_9GLOM|nr:hypothetical protein Glove_227g132 [Diversispora epigaea]